MATQLSTITLIMLKAEIIGKLRDDVVIECQRLRSRVFSIFGTSSLNGSVQQLRHILDRWFRRVLDISLAPSQIFIAYLTSEMAKWSQCVQKCLKDATHSRISHRPSYSRRNITNERLFQRRMKQIEHQKQRKLIMTMTLP